jgi:uroporphyrinogen decarboxylase
MAAWVMTGKERILAALERRIPDRVPLYIHGINEAPIIGIGRHLTQGLPEPKQFHDMTDAEKLKLVDTLFLIHEHFGVDGFTSFEIGHETPVDEKRVMDDWGIVYVRNPHGIPVAKGHPLQESSDLVGFRPPVPKREHLLLLDLARERFQGRVALFWLMRGAFVRSWRLAGMQNLMFRMISDPDFVHRVASLTLEYNLLQLDLLAAAGLDVLVVEDDIASTHAPLISPRHFQEFVEPYNRTLVERAHGLGLKVVRHSDGNLWSILEVIIDSGYDGLNPLEPQAGMDLGKVKAHCGDRVCLVGNIDCMELLCTGSQEQVREAVRKAIEIGAPGGGYILSESNSLHPGVNPENCMAMFEATKEYGRYDEILAPTEPLISVHGPEDGAAP